MSLLLTLLELADATSNHLEFVHRDDVFVSYGEETITETNLLEIRRRHPQQTVVRTFSRPREAKIGADWEWRIIGRVYTLKMRVQAKRVQRDGRLRIKHQIRSSGKYQRDQLLSSALATKMKPCYCIYSTEAQRSVWKQSRSARDCREYQSGCLLADANDVPDTTRKLSQIEVICMPWHHLVVPSSVLTCSYERVFVDRDGFLLGEIHRYSRTVEVGGGRQRAVERWDHPTIDDLNGVVDREFDPVGVHETSAGDRDMLRSDGGLEDYAADVRFEELREGALRGLLVVDARQEGTRLRRRDE